MTSGSHCLCRGSQPQLRHSRLVDELNPHSAANRCSFLHTGGEYVVYITSGGAADHPLLPASAPVLPLWSLRNPVLGTAALDGTNAPQGRSYALSPAAWSLALR
jgi:hypothetical protein